MCLLKRRRKKPEMFRLTVMFSTITTPNMVHDGCGKRALWGSAKTKKTHEEDLEKRYLSCDYV